MIVKLSSFSESTTMYSIDTNDAGRQQRCPTTAAQVSPQSPSLASLTAQLNSEQANVYDMVLNRDMNVFLTGQAGE